MKLNMMEANLLGVGCQLLVVGWLSRNEPARMLRFIYIARGAAVTRDILFSGEGGGLVENNIELSLGAVEERCPPLRRTPDSTSFAQLKSVPWSPFPPPHHRLRLLLDAFS